MYVASFPWGFRKFSLCLHLSVQTPKPPILHSKRIYVSRALLNRDDTFIYIRLCEDALTRGFIHFGTDVRFVCSL